MYVLAISSTTNCDLHLQEFEVDGHKAFPTEEPLSHISKTYVNSKMYIKKVIYIIITI